MQTPSSQLLTERPWESYLTSLYLGCLIWKMRIIMIATHRVVVKVRIVFIHKVFITFLPQDYILLLVELMLLLRAVIRPLHFIQKLQWGFVIFIVAPIFLAPCHCPADILMIIIMLCTCGSSCLTLNFYFPNSRVGSWLILSSSWISSPFTL